VLFSLGASTDAFLLLRAREVGVDTALIPTLWMVHHVAKLLATFYGGRVADRLPRLPLIGCGFGVYALTYIGFAFADQSWQIWALFVFYGLYFGLTEPTERALIKDLAPAAAHGRAFGMYHFAIGVSAIPASSLTGFVWQTAGAESALWMCAGIAIAAAIALAAFARTLRGQRLGT
jgi:predicted MFS family arabinose efflux permease